MVANDPYDSWESIERCQHGRPFALQAPLGASEAPLYDVNVDGLRRDHVTYSGQN